MDKFCKTVKMSIFKDIHIKNFRGYEDLKIDSLSYINFFVGANNVGKTTVLESVFMLVGMSNPAISWRINTLRSPVNSPFIDLRFLFHNVNKNITPELSATFSDGEERTMRLSVGASFAQSDISDAKSTEYASIWNQLYADIKRRTPDMQSEFSGRTVLTVNPEGKLDGKGIDGYAEFLSAIFISSADSSVSASFSEAVKLRKKDYIISQAKLFDPRINTIELLSDGLYVGFDGVDQMLPLSMNGIGLSKYLSIVCAAACGAYNVLLVDEIEDGLHYSAYKTLLEALYLFAKNNGIQFFITTHSIETLKYLANLANKNTELRDMTSVYSLCRTKNNDIKVYTYIGGDLADAVEQQIELRG